MSFVSWQCIVAFQRRRVWKHIRFNLRRLACTLDSYLTLSMSFVSLKLGNKPLNENGLKSKARKSGILNNHVLNSETEPRIKPETIKNGGLRKISPVHDEFKTPLGDKNKQDWSKYCAIDHRRQLLS